MAFPSYRGEELNLGCKTVFVPKSFALVQQPPQMHYCPESSHFEQRHWMIRRGGWEDELYRQ